MKQNFQKNTSGQFRVRGTKAQERKFNASQNLNLVNSLNTENPDPDIFGIKEQNDVMESYKKKGFVLNAKDEQGLHMFFSPKCVPKGLTKLQVRRSINAYFKGKTKSKLSDLFGHRLEIFIDGKFRLGASFGGESPKNSKDFHKLLKELI